MRLSYHKDAQPPGQGRERQRRRTRAALVTAAKQLFDAGQVPTVPEVADAADVSRATAYRYFPSQQALLSAVMTTDMDSVLLSLDNAPVDPRLRMDALVEADYEMRQADETQLRTWLRLSIEQHREGYADGPVIPRGGRIRAIEQTLDGLQEQMNDETRRRLSVSLSLVIGTESFLVLKDVWGLEGDDAKDIIRWACRALIDSATEPQGSHREEPTRADDSSPV
ncbi:MAG: TetR/AcrR family transcriptional regulator [Actinomycetota bacterium]|nr:TetR/AcrR family transcriptional regulator [Actinomycetota bacterium]